ncbi:MAG TPA: type II toxin-antitoxin system Phd/YefM family antitoxin [Gemmatimonadaceae bacterium]|jgi:prevent-host-death family protein|nr:type II toxin-antitoxin system Phd/YefM family antitoxin [Gemmatimonadaceae bacterium]
MPHHAPAGNTIGAGDFKQRCLQIMEAVRRSRVPVTITKRGVPIAKLVPLDGREDAPDGFGSLRGTVAYHGDITAPDLDAWPDNDA